MGSSSEWSISVDGKQSIVRITLIGFFDSTDIATFANELSSQMRTLRCQCNQHLTIVDIKAMKIQSQESVALFARVVGDDRFRSKRLAFVCEATLALMQAKRLTDRDGVKFFDTADDAERWILA